MRGEKGIKSQFNCLRDGLMCVEESAIEVEDGEGYHLEVVCVIEVWRVANTWKKSCVAEKPHEKQRDSQLKELSHVIGKMTWKRVRVPALALRKDGDI